MKEKAKSVLKNVLKFGLAIGIVAYLVSKGKLDFSLLARAWEAKGAWAMCALFILCQIMISTFRWKKLVEIKASRHLPFPTVLKTTWIGLFFSSVLPGAVTGDLVKLVYARNLDRTLDKTFLLTTILMDRVIGLIGLLCLLGVFSLFSYSQIVAVAPPMQGLLYFNFSLFAGVLIFLGSLFMPKRVQQLVLDLSAKIPLLGNQIRKTMEQVWLIGESRNTVFLCFGLSMAAHFFAILAFWKLTMPFYELNIPLRFAFTFMPVGMMAMAIPITPAGLGVGHAIFGTLFSYFGVNNGASLFNLYFVTYVFVNLWGILPYMLSTTKAPLPDGV